MILSHANTLHIATGTAVPLCGAPRSPFAPLYLWADESATCPACRQAVGLDPVEIEHVGDAFAAVLGLRRVDGG